MSSKYVFLKPYVGFNDLKGTYFLPINPNEITETEHKIGINLPDQLKDFYLQIGEGILSCGEKYPEMYIDTGGNLILPPLVAAAFYKPLEGDDRPEDEHVPIDSGDGEHYMAAMTYEILQPGDLPFFEIGDGTNFLVMRPHSENPNAVWSDCGVKIEDSFEKFIWRLYYEDPAYYGDVIDAYYQTSES